jgi:hypothetical protein
VWAGLSGAELIDEQFLEIRRDGVFEALGFVVNFVPFHAEYFREHPLDEMVAVQDAIGDIASGSG